MSKRWFAAPVVLLLLAFLLAGCGIPQDKYNAAVADLSAAQKQLEASKNDLQTSAVKISDLTSSQDKIKSDLTAAQAKNVELSANLTSFQTQLASEVAANSALTQSDDSLKARVSSLEKRIPTLTYSTYTDNDKGFAVNYPADWDKQTLANTLVYYVGRGVPANLVVTSETLTQTMSPQAYFDNGKQN